MKMTRPNFRLWLASLLAVISLLISPITPASTRAAAATLSEAPVTPQGYSFIFHTDSFDLQSEKIYFHRPPDVCPPNTPETTAAPAALTYPEQITRLGMTGYPNRDLFYQLRACSDPAVRSNIVVDNGYVYFLGLTDLMRLPLEANSFDPPTVLSGGLGGSGELVRSGGVLYALNGSGAGTALRQVDPASGASLLLDNPGQSAADLKQDNEYVYMRLENSALRRVTPGGSATDVAANVSTYYPDGRRTFCSLGVCFNSSLVYFNLGPNVLTYNNYTSVTSVNPVYTSDWNATLSVYNDITGIFTDAQYLFVFERQKAGCAPLCTFTTLLYRTPKAGGPKTLLDVQSSGKMITNLRDNGDVFYWLQDNSVHVQVKNASALTLPNLSITGIEVTQGIQDLNQSVALIAGRRTFVRVYVKSDGAIVPGVLAQLTAVWNGGSGGPLLPVSRPVTQVVNNQLTTSYVGPEVTVSPNPDRNNPDQSFTFELPWDWVGKPGPVTLNVSLNPYQFPLESNYADNTASTTLGAVQPSPRLNLTLVSFGYGMGGKSYYPRFKEDVQGAVSYINRTYPLAYRPANAGNNAPGLRVRFLQLYDEALGSLVYTAPDCKDGDTRDVCNNLRASAYVNSYMQSYRSIFGIPGQEPVYSMISDASGYFARGQESGGRVSSGPTGLPTNAFAWDMDKSYGDWYAAHEIGHSMGRAHPAAAAGLNSSNKKDATHCGHSADDGNYPYPLALIGPTGGSVAGFDPGDPYLGQPPRVYPAASSADFMSYCDNQWISPYTYEGIRTFLMNNPTLPEAAAPLGDYLVVSGSIQPAQAGSPPNPTASFSLVRRMSNPASLPPLDPAGGYLLRLLNGSGNQLAQYGFTPQPEVDAETPRLDFYQVVSYPSGARNVEVRRQSDNLLLGQYALSANPPVVSSVALVNPPDPVNGVVTLKWNSSDPDGNPLAFDIFFSRDGGATFQPLKLSLGGSSTSIDTATLGGGSAFFRVIASDGALTGQADSPVYTVAAKPPSPQIYTPAEEMNIHYGQLVNLSGDAQDPQDGGVTDAGLVWSNQYGLLGVGPLLSTTELPVGTNVITLTATNSLGLSASKQLTLHVDDILAPPGPVLSAAPQSVAWHIGSTADLAPTAGLQIVNAGGGSLNWSASTSASWLQLDFFGGATPASVRLSANLGGLQNDSVYTTTVTLTGTATNLVQELVLPVSLVIGSPKRQVPQGPQIFLPVIVR